MASARLLGLPIELLTSIIEYVSHMDLLSFFSPDHWESRAQKHLSLHNEGCGPHTEVGKSSR